MSRLRRFFCYPIQRRKSTVLVELLFPLIMIAQGATWLRAGDVFALSINYDIMRVIMPEESWGIAWITIALVSVALTLTGTLGARRLALIICGSLLLFVGASFYASNPLVTTAVPVVGAGLGALLVMIEVR